MSREFVVLARMQLGRQVLDRLSYLGEFRDECLSVHYRVISRCTHRMLQISTDASPFPDLFPSTLAPIGAKTCQF
jgi:hypothetical protein